jgi:NAD(P)-dependent dehydrogenase (short-subunit alcohol dehydrogenase family)
MATQPRSLYGTVVAITGGARGIGRATADALAREGAKVAIGDLDADLAAKEAAAIGGDAVGLGLDVTDRASFEAFIDAVEERLGPLDVLVNNAGIMPLGRFVEEDDASTTRQIDINLHGVITGSKLALRRFESRNRGHLVNIASVAGKGGFPGAATYCATKHAVVGLSEAIRAETRGTGIEISCVMPSLVNTELTSGLGSARGVKRVTPEGVATEIVSALKQPRFDVFVPRSVGPIVKTTQFLPRRLSEGLNKALKGDQVLTQIDSGARRAYEVRAAKSEPALEGGEPEKALETK